MNPIAFQVGPFVVRWYGILIVTGAILAGYVATIEARRRGEDPDHVWNALLLCLVLGIVGARLYHVFSSPQGGVRGWAWYSQHPLDIIKIWEGGLGIYGAVAGGAVGIYIYTRLHKLSFLRWLDIAAPGVILGQAIGRWGNFVNQELYGPPTTLPWGIRIDATHRLGEFADLQRYPLDTRFHPVFLYESLWNLVVFVTLMYVARRFKDRLLDGDVFLLYCILYPLGRIFVEMLRPDAWLIGGIATAQIIAVGAIVIAGSALLYRHRRTATNAG